MQSTINKILDEIDQRKEKLKKAYEEMQSKYDFYFQKGKIIFSEKAQEYNKKFKKPLWKSIFTNNIRHILSIPFIYVMLIPVIILDIGLFIYQHACFRLYRIPLVKRSDYIVFDREKLDYLNIFQKVNCMYCGYANGIFSYAVEIGGRTEKYRCPIKHAKRQQQRHPRQKEFADFGDPLGFKQEFNNSECFHKKDETEETITAKEYTKPL